MPTLMNSPIRLVKIIPLLSKRHAPFRALATPFCVCVCVCVCARVSHCYDVINSQHKVPSSSHYRLCFVCNLLLFKSATLLWYSMPWQYPQHSNVFPLSSVQHCLQQPTSTHLLLGCGDKLSNCKALSTLESPGKKKVFITQQPEEAFTWWYNIIARFYTLKFLCIHSEAIIIIWLC